MTNQLQDSADKLEQQREHFNSIAEEYRRGREEENHKLLKNLIWSAAFSEMPKPNGETISVLEPMCGYGEGRQLLAQHYTKNFNYTGFDYSDAIVSHMNEVEPELDITAQDATKYEAAGELYDLIILIGGLHHVPNHASDVVARLTPSLKPGGYFLNLEPTSGNPVFKKIRDVIYDRNRIFDEETERAFGVSELFNMFEKAGLEKHFCMYPGLLAYVLYYNPYAFPLLNVGGERSVKTAFGFDRLFDRNVIGRLASFATLSIWKKG